MGLPATLGWTHPVTVGLALMINACDGRGLQFFFSMGAWYSRGCPYHMHLRGFLPQGSSVLPRTRSTIQVAHFCVAYFLNDGVVPQPKIVGLVILLFRKMKFCVNLGHGIIHRDSIWFSLKSLSV